MKSGLKLALALQGPGFKELQDAILPNLYTVFNEAIRNSSSFNRCVFPIFIKLLAYGVTSSNNDVTSN